MRTIIFIVLLVVLVFAVRVLLKSSPAKTAWFIRRMLWTAAILVLLFLFVTGRLHWLFALIAAALPLMGRLLPYLRYVPLLRNLLNRYAARSAQNNASSSPQQSSVKSAYIEMRLDHATGEFDGTVLQGEFSGQNLQALSLGQLLRLLREVQHDNDSAALLQAYLDRMRPGWQEQVHNGASHHKADSAPTDTKMTKDEAYQILGLQTNASKQDIVAAHRRLIQKLHPDHGGSVYLAAKINLAKDCLLNL